MAVAPYAGAWIETQYAQMANNPNQVAPYAGAWIETAYALFFKRKVVSHPTRVRGLKHLTLEHSRQYLAVAPYAGAWIETVRTS